MVMRNRVALVTGAASGLGRAAARRLAADGMQVAAVDLDKVGLDETVAGFPGLHAFPCDVSRTLAVESMVADVVDTLGPIERVMHAASVMTAGPLLEQEPMAVHRVMEVNYGGVVNVARHTLPDMLARRHGEFVTFASVVGWMPTLYLGAYAASKAAVIAHSEVLYHENRNRGVRFACACPPNIASMYEGPRTGHWPRTFDGVRPLPVDRVLDAVETALDRGDFFVFPSLTAKLTWRLRRFAPSILWRRLHRIEGA